MSRDLDLDNLDDLDLAYLAQRPLLVAEIIAATGEDPLEGYDGPSSVEEFDRPNESGTLVAGSATVDVPHNLNVNGQEVTPVSGEADDSDAWDEDMKKAQLQGVIDSRNEGREEDDKIVPEGTTKADLVAALEADDKDDDEDSE